MFGHHGWDAGSQTGYEFCKKFRAEAQQKAKIIILCPCPEPCLSSVIQEPYPQAWLAKHTPEQPSAPHLLMMYSM